MNGESIIRSKLPAGTPVSSSTKSIICRARSTSTACTAALSPQSITGIVSGRAGPYQGHRGTSRRHRIGDRHEVHPAVCSFLENGWNSQAAMTAPGLYAQQRGNQRVNILAGVVERQ